MLFSDSTPDWSRFPEADTNSESQERSLRAFINALPPQDFVVRDERAVDAGVDISLELLIEGSFTNIRSQVQVKSTGSPRDKAGDVVSYPVPVHNLLYLLNSPNSPFYVLYIIPRDELRFAWARDERLRLDRDNPAWGQQQSVTLHFQKLLDGQALLEIRERIQREAQMQANVHEVLGRSSAGEVVRVCIESGTLRSTDPEQQKELILEQGITLVNAGRASEIIEAANALNPQTLCQGRIQLVLGYAYYMQSQLPSAIAALSKATLSSSELPEADQIFLSHLRDTCDYHTGRISPETFEARANSWQKEATPGDTSSFIVRMTQWHHQYHSVVDALVPEQSYEAIRRRRRVVDEVRDYTEKVSQDSQIAQILRLQVLAFWIQMEGFQVVVEDNLRWSQAAFRLRMSQDPKYKRVIEESTTAWQRWEEWIEFTIENAELFGHPLPLADLMLTRVIMGHFRLLKTHTMKHIFGPGVLWGFRPDVNRLYEQLEVAQETYRQIQFLQGELKCRMLKAQIQVMEGQVEEARVEAARLLPISQAMQYPQIEAQAIQIIQGETVVEHAQKNAEETSQVDQDERLAVETDLRLRMLAKQQLENLELPAERLPVVENEAFSMRDIARERLYWCRHLELVQDLTHTSSVETLFATKSYWSARCERFAFMSPFDCTDWQLPLSSFKHEVCRRCPYRAPKSSSESNSAP